MVKINRFFAHPQITYFPTTIKVFFKIALKWLIPDVVVAKIATGPAHIEADFTHNDTCLLVRITDVHIVFAALLIRLEPDIRRLCKLSLCGLGMGHVPGWFDRAISPIIDHIVVTAERL